MQVNIEGPRENRGNKVSELSEYDNSTGKENSQIDTGAFAWYCSRENDCRSEMTHHSLCGDCRKNMKGQCESFLMADVYYGM